MFLLLRRIYTCTLSYQLLVTNHNIIMHKLTKRNLSALIVGSALIGSFALVGTALAAGTGGFGHGGAAMSRPAVVGMVTSISGNTLTVNSKNWQRGSTASTPYTVDATNATVTKNGASSSVSAIAVGDTVMIQGTVSGSSVTATAIRDGSMMMGGHTGMNPGVFGTVASVSGTTLTVTSKGFRQNATATTYTVDASNATVTKNGANSSVSNIATGDTVMVQGTVSGTSVTAKTIRDGMSQGQTPAIQGNGQPVIGGNMTAINGSTLTVTNKSNVTYTVDASSAKVSKAGVTTMGATISNVVVGDNVVVQGTVNGTSVTASSIIDQGTSPSSPNNSTGSNPPVHRGVLNAIGGFFSHLFGFF